MRCNSCQCDIAEGTSVCTTCGASPTFDGLPHVLEAGTTLNHGAYVVIRALAQGGFGITYQCVDDKLKIPVVIKEFYPLGCARRGNTVVPSSGWTASTFADGRGRFLEEARTLARFDHPGIVRVFCAFEENETAYFVMEYLRGHTLEELVRRNGGRFDEPVAVGFLLNMCVALKVVHASGLLHRDIKPSNVMVTDEKRVVLIDFGTAREYASTLFQSHTAILTAGYAPLEQYSRHGVRRPSTDVYALAATGWHLLTGSPPLAATDRAIGVALPSFRSLSALVSKQVAAALERGLSMNPAERQQSVDELVSELQATSSIPTPSNLPTRSPAVSPVRPPIQPTSPAYPLPAADILPKPGRQSRPRPSEPSTALLALLASGMVFMLVMIILFWPGFGLKDHSTIADITSSSTPVPVASVDYGRKPADLNGTWQVDIEKTIAARRSWSSRHNTRPEERYHNDPFLESMDKAILKDVWFTFANPKMTYKSELGDPLDYEYKIKSMAGDSWDIDTPVIDGKSVTWRLTWITDDQIELTAPRWDVSPPAVYHLNREK